MAKYVEHTDRLVREQMNDICIPFLSPKELEAMHKGDDIYIRFDDKTLKKRLKRHFSED